MARLSTPFCRPRWSGRIPDRIGSSTSCSAAIFASPLRKSSTKKRTPTPSAPYPRPGRSRSRHRHRWQHVVRRLRRRHRLVLLVHVRAHRRLRTRARTASVVGQRRAEPGQRRSRRLGRRHQQRPRIARPDSASRPLQGCERSMPNCPSRCPLALGPPISRGMSTSSTTRTRRS